MSRVAIIAEIKNILEEVKNIGIVHGELRWSIFQDEFLNSFIVDIDGQKQIRTWMIYRDAGAMDYGSRENSLGTSVSLPIRSSMQRYDFKVEGWLSFADNETDTEFQQLIDDVLSKFEANISLNESALLRGVINYDIDHQFFGDYFVHHIQINFYAVERKGITPS